MKLPCYLARVVTIAFFLVVSAIAGAAESTGGDSASAAAVPESLSPASIYELVQDLDPEQTEALSGLVKMLKDSVGETANGGDAAGPADEDASIALGQLVDGLIDSVTAKILQLPETLANIGSALAMVFSGHDLKQSLTFVFLVLLALAIGLAVEKLFDRCFASKQAHIRSARPVTLGETLKVLSVRALIEIGDVLIFGITAFIALKILVRNPQDQMIAVYFLLLVVLLFRIVSAILKFVLAPYRKELRLVYTDDWTARYVYKNFSAIAAFTGAAFFVGELFKLFDIGSYEVLRFWAGLVVHGWVVYVTWKVRKGLTMIIQGSESEVTPGHITMAAWWPMISIIVICVAWLMVQIVISTGHPNLSAVKGSFTLLLIIFTPFLDTIVREMVGHMVPVMKGEGKIAEKAYHATKSCYIRIGRVVFLVLLVILVGKIWGMNITNLAQAGFGAKIATHAVGFLLVLAVGYMAWEIVNLLINRKLSEELDALGINEDEENEGGGVGLTRLATVLPIVRLTAQGVIITLTVLLALSQVGVNITPLLAGAGVLGIAIGFGAQTLVKDVVSGIFFLLDDAFRAGEYIEVSGVAGTVEKISIRSLHLRGVKGPIHVLPYGDISGLTNHSRDWVIMKLKFTIPFDTDIDKVRKLFKKIGQEMLEVPELAEKFLAPFKGQGAADVTDVGIVVRAKFTTRPGDQWMIRKEVYNRVQKAFEENGIEFARKEVRVYLPEGKDKSEFTKQELSAISAAADTAAESSTSKPSGPTDDR